MIAARFAWQLFQSTLPVWGATVCSWRVAPASGIFQSTLPVWGATQTGRGVCNYSRISIHAPRVGSDGWIAAPAIILYQIFQSTLPVWGATVAAHKTEREIGISIHAPRVGSDVTSLGVQLEHH